MRLRNALAGPFVDNDGITNRVIRANGGSAGGLLVLTSTPQILPLQTLAGVDTNDLALGLTDPNGWLDVELNVQIQHDDNGSGTGTEEDGLIFRFNYVNGAVVTQFASVGIDAFSPDGATVDEIYTLRAFLNVGALGLTLAEQRALALRFTAEDADNSGNQGAFRSATRVKVEQFGAYVAP